MFSVVIPSMWRYKPFLTFLEDLCIFDIIDEIIIIDNDPINRPSSLKRDVNLLQSKFGDEVGLLTRGENIFVNPAWNWGVEIARHDKICILNDDLIFDLRVFYHVERILSPENNVIGLHAGDPVHNQIPVTDGQINIIPWTGQNTFGFGQLMFIHKSKWIPIPDQLKMYYGDNWIFDMQLRRQLPIHIITNMLFKTPCAVTSSEFGGSELLAKEDRLYKEIMNKP